MPHLAVGQEASAVLGPVAGLAALEADLEGVPVPLQVVRPISSLGQEAACSTDAMPNKKMHGTGHNRGMVEHEEQNTRRMRQEAT